MEELKQFLFFLGVLGAKVSSSDSRREMYGLFVADAESPASLRHKQRSEALCSLVGVMP